MHKTAVEFKLSHRRAILRVRNLPVVDSFQFFGPSDTPALVDVTVEWRASGPAVARGVGGVPPTDPGAFVGEIAPAVSTIACSGTEIGFAFQSIRGASTDPLGWGQIGTHRNGVFLD